MTNASETKRPTHLIWQVLGKGDKTRWNRCGAAWANKDGKGFNLQFDAYPVTGHIVIREMSDKADTANGGQS